MTDTSNQQIQQKQGSGKLFATIIATSIALHLATYLKANYSMPMSDEQLNDLQVFIISFLVWATPANMVASIKGLISDWKEIVRAWRQPN